MNKLNSATLFLCLLAAVANHASAQRTDSAGEIGAVPPSAEWRRYNDVQAIHHAWMRHELTDHHESRIGIGKLPFGVLSFASHGFWLCGACYPSFAGDYDTGVKSIHRRYPA